MLDGTTINSDTSTVGSVAAQNAYLDGQDPAYAMGSGGDSGLFEMDEDVLKLKESSDPFAKHSYAVTITSGGGFGTDNSQTFEITGTATNNSRSTASAPVLDAVGPRTVDEGYRLVIILGAADPDTPNKQLTYHVSDAPVGATFDSTAGQFGWTPTEQHGPGRYHVNFTVSDGAGGIDSETVIITVNELNSAPSWTASTASQWMRAWRSPLL